MKKVININFKGRVIPIEEAAFEQLQHYINSLRSYFAQEEGRDEIINDIEDRIAEIFSEELKKGSTCITEEQVNNTLNSMGRVEDFQQMDEESAAATAANGTTPKSTVSEETRGQLMRNGNDKILGGVCSGLAHYLKIDPTVVRVLFAIITFGGFGAGVLIYIVMWALIPAQPLVSNIRKRLFRNPDDKKLGGVASGLASYFNIPVWIPRLVFLLPLVLGFFSSIFRHAFFPFDFEPVFITGGFGGTLFITYIILWIVLPIAQTPSEKLQMRGEKIDVNSIRNAIHEEMGGVKERMETVGTQLKTGAQRMSTEATDAAQRLSTHMQPVSRGVGHAIGVLFKAFFLIIAGIIGFALLMAVIGLSIAGAVAYPLKDFFLEGPYQTPALWGTLVFFLLVPIIGILVWVIRRISGAKSKVPYLGYTFGTLWILGWVSVMVLLSGVSQGFRTDSYVESTLPVTQPAGGKLLVKVNEPAIRNSGTFFRLDEDEDLRDGFDVTEDSLRYANIKVRVEKSDDSLYSVQILRYSFGRNRKEAEARAEKIVFRTSNTDSVLNLGSGLAIDRASKFRGQKVLVIIHVPVGKKIRFDESVAKRLRPFNMKMNDRNGWRHDEMDFDFTYLFDYKTNADYIMTEDGLKQTDANGRIIENKSPDEDPGTAPETQPDPGIESDTQRYRYKAQDKGPKQIVQQRSNETPGYRLITLSVL